MDDQLPDRIENMRMRMDPAWPASVRSIIESTLGAIDAAAQSRAPLNRAAADFVPKAREAARDAGRSFASAMQALDAAKTQHVADRAAFRAKAYGPESPHAAEIRAHLYRLSPVEKSELLFGPSADESAQRAALGAPAYLSGVEPGTRALAEADFLGRHFADDFAAEKAAEAAFEHAGVAAALVKGTPYRDLGFDNPVAFDVWMATECEPAAAPIDPKGSQAADAERMAAIDRRLAQLTA
jgi:hypothetical protein